MKKFNFILIYFILIIFLCPQSGFSTGVIVDKPDYKITSVTYKPDNQIEGNRITFTAIVENTGVGATLRYSTLAWKICQKACSLPENWTVKEKDTVRGLKVGAYEIETLYLTMEYGEYLYSTILRLC
jgi:hypothetical protein